ncbi:ROK family protein [Actinocorallia populi]|uniref:ROK family protein n=1 Tax=Actinocorallia populi TaxID=2079200 RepID=UPI001300B489|nr:ROK family protein [Actinocorallia populi]
MTRPGQRPTTPGRLLALLHRRGTITRAEATAHLGTARSAMGEAVAELAGLGLVRVGAEATSPQRDSAGRGRTSPTLDLAEDGPVSVAVHFHPSGADLAVIGLGGFTASLEQIPVAWRHEDLESSLQQVAQRIRAAVTRSGRICVGVGVGVAGVVSGDGRTVLSALYLGWTEVPLAEILETFLPDGLRVSIHNDAALTALAEFRRGAGRGASTLLVLSCEHTGIGGALVSGHGSTEGLRHTLEAGHLVLDLYGPPCPCGQRGCLELYCDGRALVKATGHDHPDAPSGSRAIILRARDGEPDAHRAVRDVANRLGTGLASLVNVLGPDRVVLAGILGDYLALAADDLQAHLHASIVARLHQTTLTSAALDRPVLLGAAEHLFEPLLADPVQEMRNAAFPGG